MLTEETRPLPLNLSVLEDQPGIAKTLQSLEIWL
jgi:hypothetical protein